VKQEFESMEAAAAAWSAVPKSGADAGFLVADAASSSFTGLLDLVVAPRREGSPPPSAYLGEDHSVVVDEIQTGRHGRDSSLRRCVAMMVIGFAAGRAGVLLGVPSPRRIGS